MKKILPVIVVLVILGVISTLIVSENFDSKSAILKDKNSIVTDILQECGRDDECVYLKLQKISKTTKIWYG